MRMLRYVDRVCGRKGDDAKEGVRAVEARWWTYRQGKMIGESDK